MRYCNFHARRPSTLHSSTRPIPASSLFSVHTLLSSQPHRNQVPPPNLPSPIPSYHQTAPRAQTPSGSAPWAQNSPHDLPLQTPEHPAPDNENHKLAFRPSQHRQQRSHFPLSLPVTAPPSKRLYRAETHLCVRQRLDRVQRVH